MSSILRALKKLEEESPPKEGGAFAPDTSTPEGSNAQDSGLGSKKNLIFFSPSAKPGGRRRVRGPQYQHSAPDGIHIDNPQTIPVANPIRFPTSEGQVLGAIQLTTLCKTLAPESNGTQATGQTVEVTGCEAGGSTGRTPDITGPGRPL